MPGVSLKILQAMVGRQADVSEQAAAWAASDVRARVAHALSQLAIEYVEPDGTGYVIPFRLTHEDLAALVGASRVMVTNVFQQLRRDGDLLVSDDRHFIVPAAGQLEPAPNRLPSTARPDETCVYQKARRFAS